MKPIGAIDSTRRPWRMRCPATPGDSRRIRAFYLLAWVALFTVATSLMDILVVLALSSSAVLLVASWIERRKRPPIWLALFVFAAIFVVIFAATRGCEPRADQRLGWSIGT